MEGKEAKTSVFESKIISKIYIMETRRAKLKVEMKTKTKERTLMPSLHRDQHLEVHEASKRIPMWRAYDFQVCIYHQNISFKYT